MSAHTAPVLGTAFAVDPKSGTHKAEGTFVGSASYDVGGSVLDMSAIFKDECRKLEANDESGLYKAVYDNTASTNAAATGTVRVYHRLPASATVTMAHTGVCFDDAGGTDSDTIFTQPANSTLVGCRLTLTEQFAATSLSALTWEIGLAGDTNGLLTGGSSDLFADAVGTGDNTMGAYFVATTGYHTVSALAWLLATAATGANLDATTAGGISVTYYYYPDMPTGLSIGGPGVECATTTDLSGVTFRFEATGTDA